MDDFIAKADNTFQKCNQKFETIVKDQPLNASLMNNTIPMIENKDHSLNENFIKNFKRTS